MLYLNYVLVKAKAKQTTLSYNPWNLRVRILYPDRGVCACQAQAPPGLVFLDLLPTLRVVVADNAAIAAKITSLVTRLPLRYKRTRGFPWVGRGSFWRRAGSECTRPRKASHQPEDVNSMESRGSKVTAGEHC